MEIIAAILSISRRIPEEIDSLTRYAKCSAVYKFKNSNENILEPTTVLVLHFIERVKYFTSVQEMKMKTTVVNRESYTGIAQCFLRSSSTTVNKKHLKAFATIIGLSRQCH